MQQISHSLPCLVTGICDIAFNLPNYEYDGGDCCLATCISSEDHSCGVIAVGQLENVNVGFPNCKDPENSCDGGACWAPSSRAIDLLFPGSKAHVTLSANGLALVVAEPDLDVVRLFDRTDSYWTQRGPVVQGVRNTDFGKIFAISTLPGEVVGIRFGRLPLIIAVGMHHYSIDGDNNSRVNAASVRVARWGANAIDWDFLGKNRTQSIWSDHQHITHCNLKITHCLVRTGEDVKVCTSETNATCEIQSLHVVQVLKEVLMPVLLSNGDMYVYRTVLTENGINLWGVIGTIRGLNASVATITGDGKRMALDSNVGGRVEIHIFDLETQERGGNWTSAFHLKSLYPNEAAELGYTFEQFYNENSESGIIEGEPTKIVAMSFLGDNSNLKVVAKGSGENDFLLRLQITGQSVLFTLEFNFALPEEDRSNYLPPVRFSEKALVSKAYQERDETASGRQIIQVFREGYTADGFLREYGEPFYSQEYIVDQSISFDGTTLATATADRVQVYGNIPTCGVNETLYRILITLDEFPSAISWSLESYQELGDDTLPLTVIATGDGRYSDNDRFSRGSVEEEVCIPKSETSCILLRFKSDVGLARGAGLVVLEGGQHISKYEGRGVKEEVVLRLSESEKCRIPKKQCDGGSSALVASVSFDKFPADLQWSLSNSRDEKLLFVENYDLRVGSTELFDNHFPDGDLAYSTVIQQACIPQDCYSLVVNDLYGDGKSTDTSCGCFASSLKPTLPPIFTSIGFCCQYGKGEISMFVDNVLVSHFKGNEVSHFRRDIFGASCSEKDYVTVTFEIQMDAFPGDISYQIVEVNDREGNPSFRPVHVVSDTFHFFVQPHFYKVETIKVSRDATYELSISDFTGNGKYIRQIASHPWTY